MKKVEKEDNKSGKGISESNFVSGSGHAAATRAAQCCKPIVPHTCRSYVDAAWPISDTKLLAAILFPTVFSYLSTFVMLFPPPIEDKYLAVALCSSLNSTLKIDAASHVSSIRN